MDKRIVAFLMGTRHMPVTANVDPAVIAVLVSHMRTMPRIVRFRHTVDRGKKTVIGWGERVVRFEIRYRHDRRGKYRPSFMRFITGTASPSRESGFLNEPIGQWCDADGTAHIVGVVTNDGRFRVEARSTARPGTVLGYVETVPCTEYVSIRFDKKNSPPFGALSVASYSKTDISRCYLEVADNCDATVELSPV